MKQIRLKVGDIFQVPLENNERKYFQYLGDDSYQLHSNVVRVFQASYQIDVIPNYEDLVNGDIQFYAHCVIKWGIINLKLWKRVGNIPLKETNSPYFRDSNDYGNPEIKYTKRWWIWKMNSDVKQLFEVTETLLQSEIGIVVTPYDIVERCQTGRYSFFYPEIDLT